MLDFAAQNSLAWCAISAVIDAGWYDNDEGGDSVTGGHQVATTQSGVEHQHHHAEKLHALQTHPAEHSEEEEVQQTRHHPTSHLEYEQIQQGRLACFEELTFFEEYNDGRTFCNMVYAVLRGFISQINTHLENLDCIPNSTMDTKLYG